MFAISYIFAYSFNIIMHMRHPIVPCRAPPDPIRVFYSGSNNTSYIVFLHGRVPEIYELWRHNDCRVCKVHSFTRVRLLDYFREDTFQTFFFNLRRSRIPFIGRRSLNASVEFICFADITLDAEVVIHTPSIVVHDWGTYPTVIYPTVSNFTRRAYDPITTQRGLILRCNHELLRLKIFESKCIALENHLARIRQDIRNDVAANYSCSPVNRALGDATPPSSNDSDSNDVWIDTSGSN